MKPGTSAWMVLGCATLIAACASSPPMRFYVLTATPGSGDGTGTGTGAAGGDTSGRAPAAAAAPTAAADLCIGRLTIPGELDRPEIVRGLAGNQLQIADQDHWAAPLSDMIRRVLNEDLARGDTGTAGRTVTSLGTAEPAVAATGAASRETAARGGVRNISLDIEQLLPAADCSVAVRATWTAPAAMPAVPAEPAAAAAPGSKTSPGPSSPAAAAPLRGTIDFRAAAPSGGTCAASDVPAALSSALGELAGRLRVAVGGS